MPRPSDRGLNRVLIDLDGVLAEDTYPSPVIGDPIWAGLDLVEDFFKAGYEVVIHTARPVSHLPRIREWLEKYSLADTIYDIVCDKPQGWVYVDDRAWNPWA